MFAQHLGHDHLGEQHLVDLVQKFPRHLEFELRWLVKFDADYQTFAPDFFDERMFTAQGINFFHQQRAHLR